MSTFSRGTANAFRNPVRAAAIIAIVGLSTGLAVVMLLSAASVQARIDRVRKGLGSTVSIAPGQALAAQGGVLTEADLAPIAELDHVTGITKTISANFQPGDSELQGAIDMGSGAPMSFGVFVTGTNNAADSQGTMGNRLKLLDGAVIDATGDADVAYIGKGVAEKNGLSVGSTFDAWNTPIKVQGIFTTHNMWADNVALFPLATVQRLTRRADEVSMAVVNVDNLDNVAAVQSKVTEMLGQRATVTSALDVAGQAIGPLEDIRRIATLDLVGALGAGAVIVFLTMLMVVRERRREIGVLKAIGASNGTVVAQFVTEALVLGVFGSAFGIVLAATLTPTVFARLLADSTAGAPGGRELVSLGFTAGWGAYRVVKNATTDLTAAVGLNAVVSGLLLAVGVAALGSAVPAWLTARVKPAEVMRGE